MPDQLSCVKKISVPKDSCLSKCDGLFITGYDRLEFQPKEAETILTKYRQDYQYYKLGGYLKLPTSIKGSCVIICYLKTPSIKTFCR